MYIETPQYVKRVSDGVFIPKVSDNRDYQEFLAWVAAGNQPSGPDDDGD